MKMHGKAKLTAAISCALISTAAWSFEPSGKVDCIAPSDPGGGWDFTCRSVGRVLQNLDLVPASVQTINMAGATGGVAFSHVVSKRSNDPKLLIAASTTTAAGLAQGLFPGMTADMVDWVGALGADYGIIAVADDSPYQNLNDLMSALQEDPTSVTFSGGDSKGSWDHLKLLMAAQKAGVSDLRDIKYLPYDGGGEALTQVVGHHVDAFTGDISEARGFIKSGDLRVLAVLSDERLPLEEYADIPTAKEQGIDLVGANWRGFYIPSDIPDDAKQYWIDSMNTLYESDEWKQVMMDNGLMPFHLSGEEFTNFVTEQIASIEQISSDLGIAR
ncbi:Bug family tripartite tricarboxylate transporter substrate binding protein [Litchfieldella rifensis]|uniref:Bug family tripartite tricarboxylate transporter substrate binding protein n=1 Tax=Litchfieldella rifensis TaxID=762643 RepID=A0ABV7LUF2_9GAMM